MSAATRWSGRTSALNREEVLKEHRPLIFKLAKPYFDRASKDDLMQEGNIALLEALETWDPARGASLWTYARPYVLGAIFKAANKEDPSAPTEEDLLAEYAEEQLYPSPEDFYLIKEREALLQKAVVAAKLGEADRELLDAWMQCGGRQEEIGEILGLPQRTVSDRVKRLFAHIREHVARLS